MNLVSINYLAFLAVIIIAYWFIIPYKYRSLFLLISSILFSCSYSVAYAFLFILMSVIVYYSSRFISITDSVRNKKIIFITVLAMIVIILCLYKYFNMWGYTEISKHIKSNKSMVPFGLSYITFRLIHFLIENYRKKISSISFVDFISYIIFFPTFLAGPVERFQKFYSQTLERKIFDISDVNYGLFRILSGLIKKAIIADNLAKLVIPIFNNPESYSKVVIISSIYCLAFKIYMDFSGYTDIAIGTARLFGYKIIENFNRPFFQKNIALFWRNWHISVYSWIRDYFFFPLFGYRASNTKIYIGVFCTMTIFMFWHRISLNFLILGIYHSLGLISWYIFQEIKRKHALIPRWIPRSYLALVSVFLTSNFVSLSAVFFLTDFNKALTVIQRIVRFK